MGEDKRQFCPYCETEIKGMDLEAHIHETTECGFRHSGVSVSVNGIKKFYGVEKVTIQVKAGKARAYAHNVGRFIVWAEFDDGRIPLPEVIAMVLSNLIDNIIKFCSDVEINDDIPEPFDEPEVFIEYRAIGASEWFVPVRAFRTSRAK